MKRLVTSEKMPVMAHLVLGYPNLKESLRTAEIYIRAGVQVLELQIPFSHPTADGPVITEACREAVRQGVTVQDCIEAIRLLREQFPEQEIVGMSYLNRIYSFGFQKFVEEMAMLGVRHLIVPDLPVDNFFTQQPTSRVIPSEARNLGNTPHEISTQIPRFARNDTKTEVKLVPVLAANVSDARLEKLLLLGFDFFYLMSDFKITGSTFSLHPRLRAVIDKIKSYSSDDFKSSDESSARVGIGFGISTPEQAHLVAEGADLAIIGSALIQAQGEGRLEAYLEKLKIVFAAATECA